MKSVQSRFNYEQVRDQIEYHAYEKNLNERLPGLAVHLCYTLGIINTYLILSKTDEVVQEKSSVVFQITQDLIWLLGFLNQRSK
jgi:hypothetical protein